MSDQNVNYVDFQQKRGMAMNAIDEALDSYRSFMLDDDYDAQRALDRIMNKLADRRKLIES